MRIKSQVLDFLHLDRTFSLLTVKNTRLILEYFNTLDVHGLGKLNGKIKASIYISYIHLRNPILGD